MKSKKKQSHSSTNLSKYRIAKTLSIYKIYAILLVVIILIIGLIIIKSTYVAAGTVSVQGSNDGCVASNNISGSQAQSFINAYNHGGKFIIQYSVFCNGPYGMKSAVTASHGHIQVNAYGDGDVSQGGYFSPDCNLEVKSEYYVILCPKIGVQNVQIYYKSNL